jgi:methanol corrinoid protein
MKYVTDTSTIFTRYDLHIEVSRQSARRVSDDQLLQQVADCLVAGDEDRIQQIVAKVLTNKAPLEVINKGLLAGMQEVSRLWETGDCFLPQLILSSDAMLAGITLCEAELGQTMQKKAKVITHTAEGDIHDIGQIIVNALLSAAGFEVINLGADVLVDEVVDACRIHKPVLLTGTALMTTTMTAFPKIAEKLKKQGLIIPFACGGGAVNEEFVTSFDLGIWGKEASQAPGIAQDALNELSWEEMRNKWNG